MLAEHGGELGGPRDAGTLMPGRAACWLSVIDEFVASSNSSSSGSRARSAPTWRTTRSPRWGFAGSERTTGRRGRGDQEGVAGRDGRGAPAVDPGARDVGEYHFGEVARVSAALRRSCSVSGWRGAGSGSWFRCWTRPRPACSPRSTPRCVRWARAVLCYRTAPGPTGPVPRSTNGLGPGTAAVHELLGQGVGLLDCARRLGWALNTVKRYAPHDRRSWRPPRYGRTLIDPYRETCIASWPPSPAWR